MNFPIYLTTTYIQNVPGVPFSKYDYLRAGNPTNDAYEDMIARMEFGKYGNLFSSGCAATTSVLSMFEKGSHILSIDDVYGGTNRLFN